VLDWQKAAPNATIANLYGPTEATVFATCHLWSGHSFGLADLPIGMPMGETRWRLEAEKGAADTGAHRGELLLSGPQVVQGYWDDPEATERAFVQGTEGETWYRTGDVAEYDPDFGLRFLGRSDFQVKARGYRIEVDEVARLVAEVTATDAPVVVPVFNEDGLCDCLVAFYEAPAQAEAALRSRCADRVPEYMVPRRFFALDGFPQTPNGKSDRTALAQRAAVIMKPESAA
jgi:acyl-CoA synthetase (AMP-forming)/AMP-acid ligase II